MPGRKYADCDCYSQKYHRHWNLVSQVNLKGTGVRLFTLYSTTLSGTKYADCACYDQHTRIKAL